VRGFTDHRHARAPVAIRPRRMAGPHLGRGYDAHVLEPAAAAVDRVVGVGRRNDGVDDDRQSWKTPLFGIPYHGLRLQPGSALRCERSYAYSIGNVMRSRTLLYGVRLVSEREGPSRTLSGSQHEHGSPIDNGLGTGLRIKRKTKLGSYTYTPNNRPRRVSSENLSFFSTH